MAGTSGRLRPPSDGLCPAMTSHNGAFMTKSNQLEFATRCVHAGQHPDPTTGAVMMPIYATSTFAQESPGVNKGYDYARTTNPTRMAFERCVADLASGWQACAFASGLATIA